MPLLSINFLKKQWEKNKMNYVQKGFMDKLASYGITNPSDQMKIMIDTVITKTAATEMDLMNMGLDQMAINQIKEALAQQGLDLATITTQELQQLLGGGQAGNQFMM